jgi:hypothetical protein
MALDLLLIAAPPELLQQACLRGWWGPLSLPAALCRFLTHLAVLAPQASAIEQVARIQAIEPWTEPASRQGLSSPLPGAAPRWRLVLRSHRTLRRPLPLGRSRHLDRWRPRRPDETRLLSIDALLMSDSIADYLRRLNPSQECCGSAGAAPGPAPDRSAADPWR